MGDLSRPAYLYLRQRIMIARQIAEPEAWEIADRVCAFATPPVSSYKAPYPAQVRLP